jgi:2-polyprenyl-6-methoxyphenol hydroxylase-like FAD-dependent oxidoreductase
MTCALSLWYSGVKDVTIVEATEQGNGNTSRAMVIHAATLEVRPCEHVDLAPSNATNRRWIMSIVPMLWSNAGSRFLK